MATTKRAKTKAKPKKKKKAATRKPATRATVRARKTATKKTRDKKTRAKTVKKRSAPGARPKKAAAARKPVAPRPRAAASAAVAAPLTIPPPGGVRVGVVTHYYSHLSVAIIRLESGNLREGDFVHVKGHTSDFSQRVASMEVEHMHVGEVFPGQSFGLKVREHAREHDIVYKVAAL